MKHTRSYNNEYHNRSINIPFKNSQNSKSPTFSKSPPPKTSTRKTGSAAKLYNFSNLLDYKNIHKPLLNSEKKKTIKEKLDIDKDADIKLKERQRNNKHFVHYDYNPFMDLSLTDAQEKAQNLEKKTDAEKKGSDFKKTKNLVFELNELQQKKLADESADLRTILLESCVLSGKIQMNMKKIKYDFQEEPQIESNNLHSKSMITQISDPNQEETEEGSDGVLDFENILKIKENNFYMDKNKQLSRTNLFKEIFNQQSGYISKEVLDKLYFCFDSIAEKIQKIKIPIYRDMSKLGRRIIRNLPCTSEDVSEITDSNELSFRINQVKFADLLSVGSGRFSSEVVYGLINNFDRMQPNKERSENSSEVQIGDIFYNQHTENVSYNFENKNQRVEEILEFIRLPLNTVENNYFKKCQKRKESIVNYANKQQLSYNINVKDKVLHKGLENRGQSELQTFFDMDRKQQNIERMIRMNKISKNKTEFIKISKLSETVAAKRELEKKIQSLIKKNKMHR